MTRWAPIRYRGFWDNPLTFLVSDGDNHYLFDCEFNETVEDYEDDYQVYSMPELADDNLPKDWTTLKDCAIRRLGSVPVASVLFDESKRGEVDLSILDAICVPTTGVESSQFSRTAD